MKMHRGVSDEGLARIAKTVKAQDTPHIPFSAFGENDAQQAALYKEALERALQLLPSEMPSDEVSTIYEATMGVEHFLEERIGGDEPMIPFYLRLDDFNADLRDLRATITGLLERLS